MKTLVLGLVSLVLLECVCEKMPTSGRTTPMTYNNRSRTTRLPRGNHTSNQMSTSSTVTWATGVTSTENKVTKNGQGHIFTSVTLLLGSSVLPAALWHHYWDDPHNHYCDDPHSHYCDDPHNHYCDDPHNHYWDDPHNHYSEGPHNHYCDDPQQQLHQPSYHYLEGPNNDNYTSRSYHYLEGPNNDNYTSRPYHYHEGPNNDNYTSRPYHYHEGPHNDNYPSRPYHYYEGPHNHSPNDDQNCRYKHNYNKRHNNRACDL
ncbi:unnamed protein product [Pleuronectes platessa]|uniref:Histidine-rich glycoprotein-like n=1 Tax=Pleuronectes platessa TaxID=8262 RepID=A0A9N7YR38_PLEPL|nr:unnamed protein product [Pleuronectes platessa]